jgi:hypothetical protein
MSVKLRLQMIQWACAGVGLVAVAAPAVADRIDGEWCFSSQSLQIEGPSIRTPGGSQIKGDYSRHAFSYVVPSPEPEAGAEIAMQLLSEELMTLSRKRGDKPEETWRRCKVTS